MFKYFLELQYRFYFILFNLFVTLCVSYFYKEVLLFLIIKPYSISDKSFEILLSYFIFTNVTDVFSMYLKLVYFITTQVGFLYIFYHIFVFFSYAMFKQEYYFSITFLKIILITWVIAIVFLNYLILPLSWNFFFSFQDFISSNFITLYFEPKINEYLNFCLLLYYSFILYCQFFSIFFFFFKLL
jgi:Sec-independent protein secretion pathway component TatC